MQESFLISYATHAHGRYEEMTKSHPDIKIGGWGTKWNGFMDKFLFVIDFLSKQNPDAIVIFVDGFDTIVKGTKEEIVERFKKFDCKMLLSDDTLASTCPKLYRSRVFGTAGRVANSGLYMGYAGYMREILERSTKLSHGEDDQKALNMIMQVEPYKREIKVDTERYIFCNLARHERSPEIYEAIDTMCLGFNCTFALDWNFATKTVNYCSLFRAEVIIITIAVVCGFVGLYVVDSAYNCCRTTEFFAILFPLTVIVMLFQLDDENRKTLRVVLGMAVLMLSFHVAFFLKRNSVGFSSKQIRT